MKKQTTRMLGIAGLGLGFVWGTLQARDGAPNDDPRPTAGAALPATRPLIAAANPATVIFEADDNATSAAPTMQGVPAAITMEGEVEPIGYPRGRQGKNPQKTAGSAMRGPATSPAVPRGTVTPTAQVTPAPVMQPLGQFTAPPPQLERNGPRPMRPPLAPPVEEPKVPVRTTISIDIPAHAVATQAPTALGDAASVEYVDRGDMLLGEAPMIGRGDQNNRFNIFNNQSALVQSHLWFGYHHQVDYNPGLQLTGAARAQLTATGQSLEQFLGRQDLFPGILKRLDQDLYRVGIEYGLSPAWSVVVQAQYVGEVSSDGATDGWSSPQFLVKRVFYQEDRCVISGVLAVEPPTEVRRGQFKEDATRVYPGLLFYSEVGSNWVVQGGLQVGVPLGSRHQSQLGTQDRPNTLDCDLSIGYWAYRHPDLLAGKTEYPGWRPFIWDRPCILGVMPQIEVTGKQVLGGATFDSPFRLTNLDGGFPLAGPAFIQYTEPRHVVNFTVGGRVLFLHDVALSGGVSFPVTGGQTSRAEGLVYLSCGF